MDQVWPFYSCLGLWEPVTTWTVKRKGIKCGKVKSTISEAIWSKGFCPVCMCLSNCRAVHNHFFFSLPWIFAAPDRFTWTCIRVRCPWIDLNFSNNHLMMFPFISLVKWYALLWTLMKSFVIWGLLLICCPVTSYPGAGIQQVDPRKSLSLAKNIYGLFGSLVVPKINAISNV